MQRCKSLAREEWTVLIVDAHPGYITWKRFEENERQIRDNAQSYGARGRTAAGPGTCGVCGRNMIVRYHTRKGGNIPTTCASVKEVM